MLKSNLRESKRLYSTLPSIIKEVFYDLNVGKKILIQGWIKSVRKMKHHIFLDVSDGSTAVPLQVVVAKTISHQNFHPGSSVSVLGTLSNTLHNNKELLVEDIKVIGDCVTSDGYPFAPQKIYLPEYVRKYLQFRPRTNMFSSLLRIRSNILVEITNYFQEKGFFQIHTPIFTSNDCEEGGEVFNVSPANEKLLKKMKKYTEQSTDTIYFGREAFLTVSGQLHLEAVAHGLSKVYTIGPVFRAENSKSRLHLSEFYMLEAEVAFVNNVDTILNLVEDLLKTITRNFLNKSTNDIDCFTKNDFTWLDKPFVVLTYDEALSILNEKNNEKRDASNLSKEDEITLVSYCGQLPTFIVKWPKKTKPFYMRACEDDFQKVDALDLLVPGVGEIVGGGLRENDYEKLQKNITSGYNNLQWYLELRKFGGVPTGGFGLGFERYLQFVLDIENIKDTIPFPRWPHNCQL